MTIKSPCDCDTCVECLARGLKRNIADQLVFFHATERDQDDFFFQMDEQQPIGPNPLSKSLSKLTVNSFTMDMFPVVCWRSLYLNFFAIGFILFNLFEVNHLDPFELAGLYEWFNLLKAITDRFK